MGMFAAVGSHSPLAKDDFLILDDPSQSLGAEHKKHLAKLLAHVARHKKLIVSTMDTEFHEYLMDCMTRARRQYHFGKWTPDEGPYRRHDLEAQLRPLFAEVVEQHAETALTGRLQA
jgi:hypothetical protein